MADTAALAREVMEYLLLRLRDTSVGGAPNVAPPALHSATGALFAFHRVGLLDEAVVEDFQTQIQDEGRRFTAVVEDEFAHPRPPRPTSPPAVSPVTMNELLDEHLRRVERMAATQPSTSRWVAGRSEMSAVITALAELRLLDEAGERLWLNRLERASDPQLRPEVEYAVEARSTEQVAARGIAPDDVPVPVEPLVHPRPQCSQDVLVELLQVVGPSGSEARVIALERYTDGCVVTYRAPGPDPEIAMRRPLFPRAVRATDDLGTHYFASGGGGGGGTVMRMTSVLAPAIPATARTLLVVIGEEGFAIDLPHSRAD